jgi:hypothetical protein
VAILAWIGGEVVGVGEFHATADPADAEVAFASTRASPPCCSRTSRSLPRISASVG